jgi:hypothetical protein
MQSIIIRWQCMPSLGKHYQILPYFISNGWIYHFVSEKKSTTNRTAEINDNLRDNTLRVVDEIAKVQPQVTQSISNFQIDAIEASKNMVKTAFDTQKQIASGLNVSEQIVGPSNEITDNFVRTTGIYNQLVLMALNAARENARIYGKTVNAVTEYNTNILNTWTAFCAAQQQHFIRI